jgi:ABC-type phosphate transport system auxiliary subunit
MSSESASSESASSESASSEFENVSSENVPVENLAELSSEQVPSERQELTVDGLSADIDLDQEVSDVAIAIQVVAQRYTQLESALEKRLAQVKTDLKDKDQSSAQQLKLDQEAKVLSKQIDAIRTTLSNELLALTLLQGVKELFWQVVRFGGVGFLLGWLAHGLLTG